MIYLALEQAHEACLTNVKALSLVSTIPLAPVVHSAHMWGTHNFCNHTALATTPFCHISMSSSYQKNNLTLNNKKFLGNLKIKQQAFLEKKNIFRQLF